MAAYIYLELWQDADKAQKPTLGDANIDATVIWKPVAQRERHVRLILASTIMSHALIEVRILPANGDPNIPTWRRAMRIWLTDGSTFIVPMDFGDFSNLLMGALKPQTTAGSFYGGSGRLSSSTNPASTFPDNEPNY